MRQAGRYMEEYRKLRAQYGFLELCKKPDLAAEITVTPVETSRSRRGDPVRRYLVDPRTHGRRPGILQRRWPGDPSPGAQRQRCRRLERFRRREASSPSSTSRSKRLCKELKGKVPLIGFAGAPFTLASYLIEGSGSRNYVHTKKLFYSASRSVAAA